MKKELKVMRFESDQNCRFLSIASYQPEIALNLGNMIRTCACFSIPLHVIEPCGFPFSLKAVKRSAMDYTESAEIIQHLDWDSFQRTVPGRRVLLSTRADYAYDQFQFAKGDILVLGQESAGVPTEIFNACEASVTIPMPGGGRSLNVSTAMAIVASEALRQQRLRI